MYTQPLCHLQVVSVPLPATTTPGESSHNDLRLGSLTLAAASQNTGVVLDCLRACNVAVRWLMLATASRQAALAESVRAAAPDAAAVAALLLDTSLLEYEVTILLLRAGVLTSSYCMWFASELGHT